jgi:hypothetical protein
MDTARVSIPEGILERPMAAAPHLLVKGWVRFEAYLAWIEFNAEVSTDLAPTSVRCFEEPLS